MTQDRPEAENTEVRIGGYRLVSGLGRGNTSRVYLAEKVAPEAPDTTAQGNSAQSSSGQGSSAPARPFSAAGLRAGTRVALKVPLPETRADQAAAERFANEVRLTLQFRHPHLVAGLDGTAFGPDAYLAMHHYPGGTLARQLAYNTLTLPETLRVLADVASGMAYLHHAGAVHQDVKTQNVYLEKADTGAYRAALGDFGSTYFQSQGGKVSGSPYYMAPEVYQGEMTGPPSDVYSFGVLAFELLTGERPHLGDSYERLMVSHLTHFPSPMHVQGLPKALSRLLDAALAKRPGDRPKSALLRRGLLETLGEPDETDAAAPEPAEEKSASRASVGRHGPDVPTPAAALPDLSSRRTASRGTLSGTQDKRGWNPFRKKK